MLSESLLVIQVGLQIDFQHLLVIVLRHVPSCLDRVLGICAIEIDTSGEDMLIQ